MTQTANTNCPVCKTRLNAAMGIKLEDRSATPEPGDASVCIRCAAMLRFGENFQLAELTPEEFIDLPADVRSELKKVQRIILDTNKETSA